MTETFSTTRTEVFISTCEELAPVLRDPNQVHSLAKEFLALHSNTKFGPKFPFLDAIDNFIEALPKKDRYY